MASSGLAANSWNESQGTCACCGRQTRTVWGDLSDPAGTHAVYFVTWTPGVPEHAPNVDLVLGRWGEGAASGDRVLVALRYHPKAGGGAFTVIDGQGRPADDRSVCGRALRRVEVIGTPLATEVFALVDALWLTEPRMAEIRGFDDALAPREGERA
jgi:hypothetical protein